MSAINMIHIYASKRYKGNWVALENFMTKPKVVAYAKTLKEAMEKANKKGYDMPAMMRIPEKVLPFVGAPRIIE